MKKIGEYTTRGVVSTTGLARITLFDGRFDTGYRVVKFDMAMLTQNVNAEASCKLLTDDRGSSADSDDWNWDNNEEIAWARTGNNTTSNATHTTESYVDPDNMIIEDLYIKAATNEGDAEVNYMIVLEKYEFTEWNGALNMVRNSSQSVG